LPHRCRRHEPFSLPWRTAAEDLRTSDCAGKTGKRNPCLKRALGEAAAAAARTDTFLGERYRRIVKHRGKPEALVAVARSILVIIWHLLADLATRFRDLGPNYHSNKAVIERRLPNHIAQLTVTGCRVTLEPAA
jgi:transposase